MSPWDKENRIRFNAFGIDLIFEFGTRSLCGPCDVRSEYLLQLFTWGKYLDISLNLSLIYLTISISHLIITKFIVDPLIFDVGKVMRSFIFDSRIDVQK